MLWLALIYVCGVLYTWVATYDSLMYVPVVVPPTHRFYALCRLARAATIVLCMLLWPLIWASGLVMMVYRFFRDLVATHPE